MAKKKITIKNIRTGTKIKKKKTKRNIVSSRPYVND